MFGKKSFDSIMSSFNKAKEDLIKYSDSQRAKRDEAEAKAKVQVGIANACVDEIQRSTRTLTQLNKILGE